MSNSKLVLGALAGIAIGSLLGVLFAPQSGARTRKRLLNKGEEYADDVKEKMEEYMETIKDKYEEMKTDVEKLVHQKIA